MAPAGAHANRWTALGAVVENRWLGFGLAGLTLVAVVLAALEWVLGLHPGPNLAFAAALLAFLTWSAVGLRAAAGEPDLGHWRRLLELAEVRGAVAGVDIDVHGHPAPALADIAPDAHLHVVNPRTHIALPLADDSSDAVVLGPRVAALDEASRDTLLDDARRVLRVGGHLVMVVPTEERRGWFWGASPEWRPGSPQGWWSDPLAERFEEVRYAPLNRRWDVLLATRTEPPAQPTETITETV